MLKKDNWIDKVGMGEREYGRENRTDFGLSSLRLSSPMTRPIRHQTLSFDCSLLSHSLSDGDSFQVSLKLHSLSSLSVTGETCFLVYGQTNGSRKFIFRSGEEVLSSFASTQKWLIGKCSESEVFDGSCLKRGVKVEFKKREEFLNSSEVIIHIFQIKNSSTLLFCSSFRFSFVSDSLSDCVDSLSLCDSDSFDFENITDFDLNELDSHIPSQVKSHSKSVSGSVLKGLLKVKVSDSLNLNLNLNRKRSFRNRDEFQDTSTVTSTAYYDYDYEYDYQQDLNKNTPKTLKKLKSARNVKFSNQTQSPLTYTNNNNNNNTKTNSLNRCASAPPMKLRELLKKESKAIEAVKSVFSLLGEISQKSQDKFVKVVTKFVLSKNETLTKAIQKELNLCSQAHKVFLICFDFFINNFPPFRKFCSELNFKQTDKQLYMETAIDKISKQQFTDFYLQQTNINSTFDYIKGPWVVTEHCLKNLVEVYEKLGFPSVVVECFVSMERRLVLSYEEQSNCFLVEREEKLFSSGKIRLKCDGISHSWTVCNPLLQERHNFMSYCCVVVEGKKFNVESVVVGGSVKLGILYDVMVNGDLECVFCISKANLKPNEAWTMVYCTKILYVKEK